MQENKSRIFRAAEKSGVQILGVPILQGCVLVSDSEESMEYTFLQRGLPSFWRSLTQSWVSAWAVEKKDSALEFKLV